MLPSPSLGPPLLSASWSPPLPCGIELVDDGGGGGGGGGAGDVGGGAGAVVGLGFGLGFGLCVGVRVGDADDVDGCAAGDVVWCCLAAGCDALDDEQPAASIASRARPTSDRLSMDDIALILAPVGSVPGGHRLTAMNTQGTAPRFATTG